EEDARLELRPGFQYRAAEQRGDRDAEKFRQSGSADHRSVVELQRPRGGDFRPMQLQLRNAVNELRTFVRAQVSARLLKGDDVGGGLFDDRVAEPLQLADQHGLAGARSAGEDDAFHGGKSLM